MQTYLTLIRYTDQGIKNMKESPARLDAVKKAYQAAGGELKAFYLAMGSHDAVAIGEAPSDEVLARLALMIAAQGNLRTESMRIFPEAEYRKIVAGLP
jgi:uncharacterized protein with GYD domain